jgi:hypothetical protein
MKRYPPQKKFTENMLQIHFIMAKAKTRTTGKNYDNVIKKAPHLLSSPAAHIIHQQVNKLFGVGEQSTNFI